MYSSSFFDLIVQMVSLVCSYWGTNRHATWGGRRREMIGHVSGIFQLCRAFGPSSISVPKRLFSLHYTIFCCFQLQLHFNLVKRELVFYPFQPCQNLISDLANFNQCWKKQNNSIFYSFSFEPKFGVRIIRGKFKHIHIHIIYIQNIAYRQSFGRAAINDFS